MEICPKKICTGCLACYNACSHKAIELRKDDEGFLYPDINTEVCVDCGLCKRVCPIVDGTNDVENKPIATYAAWNKCRKIVQKSSSGGLFSTIAEWILAKKGVVYGAAFDENLQVKHIRIEQLPDLDKLRGSKYVHSFIGENYRLVKEDLRQRRWVLFSGTPCQIAGLKKFINEKNSERLITIDVVCHGVPSPLMFEEYKHYLERKYQSKMVSYFFRDKKWSWVHFNMRATFENGSEYIGKWEEDFFSRGYLREFYQRPACHSCHFTSTNRCGDFTLADFWGFKRNNGEKNDNDLGVSLVITNTSKAEMIMQEIKKCLVQYDRVLEDALVNRPLREPTEMNPDREKFWQDYREMGYDALINKYFYPEPITGKSLRRLYKYGRIIDQLYRFFQKRKQKLFEIIVRE